MKNNYLNPELELRHKGKINGTGYTESEDVSGYKIKGKRKPISMNFIERKYLSMLLISGALLIFGALFLLSAGSSAQEMPPGQESGAFQVAPEAPDEASPALDSTAVDQKPELRSLVPDLASPQSAGTAIRWTATASDPDGDQIYYKFWLKGPSTGDMARNVTDWTQSNEWTWNTVEDDAGSSEVEVQVRDGKHAGAESYDNNLAQEFVITPAAAAAPPSVEPSAPAPSAVPETAAVPEPNIVPETIAVPETTAVPGPAAQVESSQATASQPEAAPLEPVSSSPFAPESPQDQPSVPNQPPVVTGITSDKQSPQEAGTVVVWSAEATDPESDPMLYRFLVNSQPATDWISSNIWAWNTTDPDVGNDQIEVQVRDGNHAGLEGFDSSKMARFVITEPNQKPSVNDLTSDKQSPLDYGAEVTWTASASDPENDPILYRFLVNDRPATDWVSNNKWSWSTSEADVGTDQVEVQVRDGNHAGPDSYDGNKVVSFEITRPNQKPVINDLTADKQSPQVAGTEVTWTAIASDPENDPLSYIFLVNGKAATDWISSSTWVWNTDAASIGDDQVEVRVRDGKHADSDGYDGNKIAGFQITAPNQPPAVTGLESNLASPQDSGTSITWTATASDPETDPLFYRFLVNDKQVADWISSNIWTWNTTESDVGTDQIEVQVRDGNHAGLEGFDSNKVQSFDIAAPKPVPPAVTAPAQVSESQVSPAQNQSEAVAPAANQTTQPAEAQSVVTPENRPPVVDSLVPDKPSPQDFGTRVNWTASASDPENDPLLYQFLVRGRAVTDWIGIGSWIWNTTEADVGQNQVEVRVRDGNHVGPEGYDSNKAEGYEITAPAPAVQPNVTAPVALANVTEPVNVTVPSNETTPVAVTPNETIPVVVPPNQTIPVVVPPNETAPAITPSNETIPAIVPSNETIPAIVPSNETMPSNVTAPANETAPSNVTIPSIVPPQNETIPGEAELNVTEPPAPRPVGNLTISGAKFNDQNGNGARDDSEPGMAGWTIRLTKPDGTEAIATTGSDGSYKFESLSPGAYNISEVQRLGWAQTMPAAGSYSLNLDADAAGQDFGNRARTFSISGQKFNDQNGNGARDDAEPGLPGWSIRLAKPDGTSATATTSDDGSYRFDNLTAGIYNITEVQQQGWTQTTPVEGYYSVSLADADATAKDFGNKARTYAISGQKFNDQNGNGARDGTEPALPGWTISLTGPDGKEATASTGPDGLYRFDNLTAGSYAVSEVAQPGWVQTAPQSGNRSVTISGEDVSGQDFGNEIQTYAISGQKFNDQNGNGVREGDEPGLSGWTIKLTRPDLTEATAATAQDGSYRFENLGPGNYTISEVAQPSWNQTAPAGGSYLVTLAVADITAKDFGNRARTYSILGKIFNDLNNTGSNEGEPGLQGWTATLTRPDGSTIDATAGVDGTYKFTDLEAGTYTLAENLQPGWTQTTAKSYSVVIKDADVTGKDFGNHGGLSISGTVFSDKNANGSKDGSDSGLAGWTLKLAQSSNITDIATTASDGSYSFKNLAPGTYTVSEVLQEGWSGTVPEGGSYTIDLANENVAGKDFGNRGNLSITGRKYYDANGNGIEDPDDPGIPNGTVSLMENNNVIDTTTTDKDGVYTFANLAQGTYTISDPPAGGFVLTTSSTITVTLTGTTATVVNANFGLAGTHSISGAKYFDANGNGARDSGETGVPGWLMHIDGTTTFGGVPVSISRTTAADGSYVFDHIAPGTYTISEAARPHWVQTAPGATGTYNVIVTNSNVAGRDFGNRVDTLSISGVVYNDINGNGVKDAGEPGLPGWTIALGGASSATAVTASDGSYIFPNLAAGSTYTVGEVMQPGWSQRSPPGGSYSVTLTSASTVGRDFGNYNAPPSNPTLVPSPSSPQNAGTPITWTAGASNPEGDPLQYRFFLRGPLPSSYWAEMTDGWTSSNAWTWETNGYPAGDYEVDVWIRDGKHSFATPWDAHKVTGFKLTRSNLPPAVYFLYSDRPSPQLAGSWVRWRAAAYDPEGDQILYRFFVRGQSTGGAWQDMTGWTRSSSWVWRTTNRDSGFDQVSVWVRDGKHAGPEDWDDTDVAGYYIIGFNQPPSLTGFGPDKPSPQAAGSAVRWEATSYDPDGDPVLYRYLVKATDSSWRVERDWSPDSSWLWATSNADAGQNVVQIQVRDGYHAGPDEWDDADIGAFTVIPYNRPPTIEAMSPDLPGPQNAGSIITWTAAASDPERDRISYQYWLKGPSTSNAWRMVRDWSGSNTWIWSTGPRDAGDYTVYVYVRDGKHASILGYDAALSAGYKLLPPLSTRKLTTGTLPKDRPSLAFVTDGYLMAYQSWENGQGNLGDIRLQKFDPTWKILKSVWTASNPAYQDAPSVLMTGGFNYVTYVSGETGNLDIFVAKYDQDLKLVETRKLTRSLYDQDSPSLISVGNQFFLAYLSQDRGYLGTSNVYVTQFNQTWAPVRTVRVTSLNTYVERPSIVFGNNSFYVAYASGQAGNMDVYMRRLDANLNPGEVRKMTSGPADHDYPSLNWVNGQFILLYSTLNSGGYDLYMERFYRDWRPIDKAVVVADPGDQTWPTLMYSPPERIYWLGYASSDLEGQNIYVAPLRLATTLRDCDVAVSFSAARAGAPYVLTAKFYNNYGELTDPTDIGFTWTPQDGATVPGPGLQRVSRGTYQFSSKFGTPGDKAFRIIASIDGCLTMKTTVVKVT